jgi:hypothetical protein
MELHFCDLCQEAVPQADIDAGAAFVRAERVVCKRCNLAMGNRGGGEPSNGQAELPHGQAELSHGQARGGPATPRRPQPLISSGLGAVLGLAAIGLTLVAVVALLFRIEMVARDFRRTHGSDDERLAKLELRSAGTRDGMIARAQSVAEDAVYHELERFGTFERQLAELRQALAAGEPADQGDVAGARPPAALDGSALLTLGDALQRVDELEAQILFLQARVFELLESDVAATVPAEPEPRLLLPSGEIGVLIAQLAHQDPIERVSALYALALVEDTGIVRHVTPLLKDPDAYLRTLAARILERMRARSAVQSLIEALGDTAVGVREAAVSALRVITEQQFRFDPRGRGNDRFEAVKRWNAWWEANWKSFLYSEE